MSESFAKYANLKDTLISLISRLVGICLLLFFYKLVTKVCLQIVKKKKKRRKKKKKDR